MNDNRNSVLGKLNIELYAVCFVSDRLSESCESVFRSDRR